MLLNCEPQRTRSITKLSRFYPLCSFVVMFLFRCEMQRYTVSQFDADTFVVADNQEKREICVCENYDQFKDAEARATNIAFLLNKTAELMN